MCVLKIADIAVLRTLMAVFVKEQKPALLFLVFLTLFAFIVCLFSTRTH
jgi:hypothetical protein